MKHIVAKNQTPKLSSWLSKYHPKKVLLM